MPEQDKVIISDTSCLIGLTNIGRLDVLQKLYGTVMITPEVADEYSMPLPKWITVHEVKDTQKIKTFNKFIDLGIEITGTLGLLIRAYKSRIIDDIDEIIAQLRRIHFRIPANAESMVKHIY